jgi:peptidoglycan/xylan/chitin deacetylase (PgdA/CDA1 family)
MGFAYLTIDDGPSDDFERKIALLRARRVPAVFFCIGEQLERRPAEVVDAIRDGFLIANHSYSHPAFSQLSIAEATREIAATDSIIEALYRSAGRPRPMKLFRFPYGDRGRSADGLRHELRDMGYVGLRISSPRLPFPFLRSLRFHGPDSWWTFDLRDWCLARPGHTHAIHSTDDVMDRLDREMTRARWRIGSNHVLLMHDHVETGALFTQLIDRLLAHGVDFRLP